MARAAQPPHEQQQPDPELEAELQRLGGFDLHALREAWRERFGPPPRLRSPDLLRRRLAWRLQAERWGGLDAETETALLGLTPARRRPELQVGARYVREWKGERCEVEVLEDGGVLHRGERFASLSEVARAITGSRWSGPRFFGLRG